MTELTRRNAGHGRKASFGRSFVTALAFLLLLAFSPVNAAGLQNISLNYVYNGTDWVPWLATADGKPKVDLNLLNITTGNLTVDTNVLFVNSATDRVGIGTISPASTLHVVGTANITQTLFIEGINISGRQLSDNTTLAALLGQKLNLTGGTLSGLLTGTFGTFANGLNVTAGGLIVAAGNVGIGTAGPTQKLDVAGHINVTGTSSNSSFSGDVRIVGTLYGGSPIKISGGINITGVGTDKAITVYNSTGAEVFSVTNEGAFNISTSTRNVTIADSTLFVDSTNSRVGIGTAGPTQKLDVSGTVKATAFSGDGSALTGITSIPAGTVIFYNGTSCPSGWANFSAADGRVIVGLPAGGTLGGTVGSAFTNAEDRTHTHTGPSHTHTYSDVIAHTHAVDPPATASGGVSAGHTHAVDPPATASGGQSATHTHAVDPPSTSVSVSDPGHNHNVAWAERAGTFSGADYVMVSDVYGAPRENSHPLFGGSATTGITASVDIASLASGANSVDHTHTTDIGSFTSGAQSADHTHTTDIGSFTSGSTGIATGTTAASGTGSTGTAATSSVMPYIQLKSCIKT